MERALFIEHLQENSCKFYEGDDIHLDGHEIYRNFINGRLAPVINDHEFEPMTIVIICWNLGIPVPASDPFYEDLYENFENFHRHILKQENSNL